MLGKLKRDLKLVLRTPEMDFSDKPNLNYWSLRNADIDTLNSFQTYRVDFAFPKLSGKKTLDLGSGLGQIVHKLSSKGVDVTASDYSDETIGELKARGLEACKLDLINGDIGEAFSQFQAVTCFEVLEHLPFPERVIQAFYASDAETFIFSVPNTGYYPYRLRLLSGRFPCQWRAQPGEHLRYWTIRDMHRWLRSLGVQSYELVGYEGLPVFERISPNAFSMGMIVCIQK